MPQHFLASVYLDGIELDPSEYTLSSSGIITLTKPIPSGRRLTFRVALTRAAEDWAYGDMLDFDMVGSRPNHARVMYIGRTEAGTHKVLDVEHATPLGVFECGTLELSPLTEPVS